MLLVTCPLGDATVWVDERLVGEVREVRGGILIDPGPHRIEIRRELHYPKYFEVDARAGERRPLACDLVPQPE